MRWIGFAPYTKNEIRICSVDAPDLIANIRAIKTFMDKSGCEKVVYDVYLTRKQNGNTELSRLDYSGKDYEIGEFIRQSKIAISIRNVESASDVKAALSEKPVHIAFYFDQSTYAIEFGPNNKNLYINPLVVTYDYDFDEIQHRGSIFPSSEMSSSKLEDFIHFEGLPHLYSGRIISDATKATKVIKEVIFEESERRGRLLAEARVANIVEYNKKVAEKLAPIVVVIDEFADLADQLETTKEKNAFYKPVQRIAQAGRSRGIHLVICTQRPEAKLVPSTTKAQLNGRVALRVNDGISSRMIIEEPDAQYLQKHGDMIYRNGDIIERAQGYLIEIEELDKIVDDVIHGRI